MLRNYQKETSDGIVEIDYYLELLGVIAAVTNNNYLIYNLGREYNNRRFHRIIRSYFERVEMSEVCELMLELAKKYYFYNESIIRMFLMMSYKMDLDRDDVCQKSEMIEEEKFDYFLQMIETFRVSGYFSSFYARYRRTYNEILEQFVKDYNLVNPLQKFCKLLHFPVKQVKFILMTNITNNDYTIELNDIIHICLRPVRESRKNRNPYYTYNTLDWVTIVIKKYIENDIYQLVDKYYDQIQDIIDSENIILYQQIIESLYYENALYEYICDTIIYAILAVYIDNYLKDDFYDFIDKINQKGYYKVVEVYKEINKNLDQNVCEYIIKLIDLF